MAAMRRCCHSHVTGKLAFASVLVLHWYTAVLAASARSLADAANPAPAHRPEDHNGIGNIKVFTYGDEDELGHRNLRRLRALCSSTTTRLTNNTGQEWSWHEKLNRLLPMLRQVPCPPPCRPVASRFGATGWLSCPQLGRSIHTFTWCYM
jgi:hypothetical protein